MKKSFLLFLTLALLGGNRAGAQSLKDILNSSAVRETVSALTGNKLSAAKLPGTWKYSAPACQFKSDDLLKKAGGAVASAEIEKKLAEYYAKAGITPGLFGFTFKADSTFTTTGKKSLCGTYSLDEAAQVIHFTFTTKAGIKLLTTESRVSLSGDKLSILFNADKILKIVVMLSSATGNATLQSLGSLAGSFDGMLLGFEMEK